MRCWNLQPAASNVKHLDRSKMMNPKQAWKLDNKEWLKQRKLHFKEKILPVLKDMVSDEVHIRKKDLRYLKAYYIKGECLPYDERWLKLGICPGKKEIDKLGTAYQPTLEIKFWFYPEYDEKYFNHLVQEAFVKQGEHYIRQEYGLDLRYLGCIGEFFDNRLMLMDKLMAPRNLEEIVGSKPENVASKFYERNLQYWQEQMDRAEQKFGAVLGKMEKCLYANGSNYIFAFAFELFVDLAKRLEFSEDNELLQIEIKNIINVLQYPPQPLVLPENNAMQTIELYKQLPAIFEAGLHPMIDEWWAQAKQAPLDVDMVWQLKKIREQQE